SSHQLSELERVCDAAAIIDGGRVLDAGTIDELAGGRRQEVTIGCNDPAVAMGGLDGQVARAQDSKRKVPVGLQGEARASTAAINRQLVEAGLSVWHIELEHPTLEQRFLDITSPVRAAT